MEEFLKLFSLRDILLHVLNTTILFVVIRFLVYKPVRAFLNARAEKIAGELENASGSRMQAERMLSEAQGERQTAEAAAAQLQSEATVRAQQIGDDLIAAAKAQAEEIVQKARAEAGHVKVAAQEEMQAQALSMAVLIAEKMIGRELAEKDNAALARQFLSKVG